MDAVTRLINTAKGEIGYLEKASKNHLDSKIANAGDGNWTKYAQALDNLGVYNTRKNGYAWCDVFVDWCMITTFGLEIALHMTGQPLGGYGASCTESARYYKHLGTFHRKDPRPGDQIFFSNDGGKTMNHTGLVERVAGGQVYTIEGNTSCAIGVIPNGGAVRGKSYPINYAKIGGYGTPDWDLVAEEEDKEMTQEKFNSMFRTAMAAYRADLQDNDSSTYSEEARNWAAQVGLIKGNGTTASGEPNYMWQDLVTREQLITILYREMLREGRA